MGETIGLKVWDNKNVDSPNIFEPINRKGVKPRLETVNDEGVLFNLSWPEAALICGVPKEKIARIYTKGLYLCSSVTVGFTNPETEAVALFMNHAPAHSGDFLKLSTDNALKFATAGGYLASFASVIGSGNEEYKEEYVDLTINVDESLEKLGLSADKSMYVFPVRLVEWQRLTEWPVPGSHEWQLDYENGAFSTTLNSSYNLNA